MVDPKVPVTEDSAEKAYAAASEGVSVKPAPSEEEGGDVPVEATEADAEAVAAPAAPEADPEPVEFPGKAKRVRKSRPAPVEALIAEPAPAEPAPAEPEVAPVVEVVSETPKPVAPKAKSALKAKPASKAKPVKKAAIVKAAIVKKVAAKPAKKPAPIPAKPSITVTKKIPTYSQLKDKIMATTTKTPDFTKGFQDVFADFQEKAKSAFEKSTASFGEVSEFAKGNVEAIVESGKILAAGVQELGSAYVSESRSAFETLSADVKELASSKTPADFMKLQGELMRRNLDAAVAASSKNGEAVLKLATETFAPISSRFSLAVEKIKKAA